MVDTKATTFFDPPWHWPEIDLGWRGRIVEIISKRDGQLPQWLPPYRGSAAKVVDVNVDGHSVPMALLQLHDDERRIVLREYCRPDHLRTLFQVTQPTRLFSVWLEYAGTFFDEPMWAICEVFQRPKGMSSKVFPLWSVSQEAAHAAYMAHVRGLWRHCRIVCHEAAGRLLRGDEADRCRLTGVAINPKLTEERSAIRNIGRIGNLRTLTHAVIDAGRVPAYSDLLY